MFGKVMSVVLSFLNISAFAKDKNGKSVLLSTQEKQLEEKYGKTFLEVFKKDLEEFEKSGKTAEEAVTDEVKAQLEADRDKNAKELKEAREKIAALDAKIAEKDAEIAKLGKEETKDAGIHVEGNTDMTKMFKPDMSLNMNKYLEAAHYGRPEAASYTGNDTIDTEELHKEFGRYISSQRWRFSVR